MRKRITVTMLALAGLLATSGFAMGVTYAAYSASKTYSFNPSDSDRAVSVHAIAHYFASGAGTSGDPYVVSAPAHLRNLAKLNNMGVIANGTYFSMPNSFNWSGDPMEPIGTEAHPWNSYFRGNCHTIQGLKVEATGAYAGMFGYVGGGHGNMVSNLCLSSPTIDCKPTSATAVTAGLLAGYVNGGTSGTVAGIMIYGGNELSIDGNDRPLITRAALKANANATITSSADTKSLIIGNRANAGSLGIMSFVAHMGDINVSDSNFIEPDNSSSSQSSVKISGTAGSFAYSYYRHSNDGSADANKVIKVDVS